MEPGLEYYEASDGQEIPYPKLSEAEMRKFNELISKAERNRRRNLRKKAAAWNPKNSGK